MFPCDPYQSTKWKKIEGLENCVEEGTFCGEPILKVKPEALEKLAQEAFHDISHFLRTSHLSQLKDILNDPEASSNDRFVALDLLRNSQIASEGVLPMCQDTGTAIIMAKKGRCVWTPGRMRMPYPRELRVPMPRTTFVFLSLHLLGCLRKNTKSNLPAQIDLYQTDGNEYHFLFMAKGGGSANKTFLHQGTPSLLKEELLLEYLDERIAALGTAACPPYHLAVVIGGTSAEANLKTVKLASARYLDGLPTEGDPAGHAIRCPDMEQMILNLTQKRGIGAQFGGKYFCLDVRVIRLPRHGASLPIGIGVSCSADRQALGKITKDGVFLEQLETNPSKFLPAYDDTDDSDQEAVQIDLNMGMEHVLKELSKYPVRTRLSLNGPLIVARDLAHSRLRERLNAGRVCPNILSNIQSIMLGRLRLEGYALPHLARSAREWNCLPVNKFQTGGSIMMLAKGNRSKMVVQACKKHGGFYQEASGVLLPGLLKIVSKKLNCSSTRTLVWKRFERSKSKIFPPLLLPMIKEMISLSGMVRLNLV